MTSIQVLILIFLVKVLVCNEVHLNQWAVEVEGGIETADSLAEQLGFINTGQIGSLKNHYLFIHHGIVKRSAVSSSQHDHVQKLHAHPSVKYVKQQVAKKRVKRDFMRTDLAEDFSKQRTDLEKQKFLHDLYDPRFRDALYQDQWYLHGGASEHGDMGVLRAWEKGYTGKNIVVSILDDGIEGTHQDLAANYDPKASYDINGHDLDPTPRYDPNDENRHGTRCAGEVAATANNSLCGVGIAYNAFIGGVRMLDGDVSDAVEAQSLSLNSDHIDIYSASWGPDDNGKVVDGPAQLAMKAFTDGVTSGRHGRGSIFVWASGNGGSEDDSCNCDGYTNSIYTLSISSVSEHNRKPWYLEECSSTLASTYSSGASYTEKQVVTTDIRNRCTISHTGTSASAPLAAGICALALEANPNLTWRDMQYITLMTADPYHVRNDGKWVTNGLGRKVSLRYGYGIMDAGAMVSLAERWTTVPEQHVCLTGVLGRDKQISGKRTEFVASTDGCVGTDQEVSYLEHVQARISLEYSHRGNLRIYLRSPNGTTSTLLPKRRKDLSRGTFDNWPFMSVHFWGERPTGKWTLILENPDAPSDFGTFGGWQLVMYGTAVDPVRVRDPVRKSTQSRRRPLCDPQCSDAHSCRGPNPEDCNRCKHFRRGVEGPCVQECEENEFADPVSRLCVPCHTSCLTCQGPDENDCIDCKNGIFLVQSLGQCMSRCPGGYYADAAHGVCSQCLYPCLTCLGGADRCTSCPQGLTVDRRGRCSHPCKTSSSGSAYLNKDNECSPCHDSCLSCNGPSERDCLSCPSHQVLHSAMCLNSCPLNYFKYKQECLRCFRTCTSCLSEGPAACLTCAPGYSLHQSHCIPAANCSSGLYFNIRQHSCLPCHHSCKTCDGGGKFDCTQCPDSVTLLTDSRQCMRCCPDVSICPKGMSPCVTSLSRLEPHSTNDESFKAFARNMNIFGVLSCFVGLLFFLVCFGLIYAKSEGYICFKREISYQALDALYNDRIMLAEDEFTDEEDIFVADSGDKGKVQFVPIEDSFKR